jgi:hypothetical protein
MTGDTQRNSNGDTSPDTQSRGLPPLTGVVRGNTIELDRPPGLPDGHRVTVMLHPPPRDGAPAAGTGAVNGDPHPAFAAWADDADALEASLQQARRDRELERDRDRDPALDPDWRPDPDIHWPEGLR